MRKGGCFGLFTLHQNGTGTGTGNGKRINGFQYIMQKCSHWSRDRDKNQDPLLPIVLVPFPVPVPFSVTEPLLTKKKGPSNLEKHFQKAYISVFSRGGSRIACRDANLWFSQISEKPMVLEKIVDL